MVHIVENNKIVKIGSKKGLNNYISACLFALGNEQNEIKILARGNNIKTAMNVLAILKRDYVDNLKYIIEVDTEKFKSGEGDRNVTTLEITLSGIKKVKIEK